MSAYVRNLVRSAKAASYELAKLSSSVKNKALMAMSAALMAKRAYILKENKKDIDAAEKSKLKKSFIDRLTLTHERLREMSISLKEVAALANPIGETISRSRRPNGIRLEKVRVPIGVVLIVYEARPNVTSDCISLLFKTGNVGILRGGRNAFFSNMAIAKVLRDAVKKSGINFKPFFMVEKTEHAVVDALLKQNELIDLVIPRGGESLIRKVAALSSIPVIKHYKGVCHIFVDKSAHIKRALRICLNAKVQRPSVCNAVETILVHEAIAKTFLPLLKKEYEASFVKIKGDKKTRAILKDVASARKSDWTKEYLDLIVTVGVVKNIDEAIAHINHYGSHHTDAVITNDARSARRFENEVDSACCFVNISTRFSDGFQFGLGAEIGISTDKLHARGPMGLEELTTYKWIARGSGQIRT